MSTIARRVASATLVFFLGLRVGASVARGLEAENPIVRSNTEFGFALLRQLCESRPGANVLISPTSIAAALHMTWNGAAGTTKAAMAHAMSLEGLTARQVNQANLAIRQALAKPDSGVELKLANSLWAFMPGVVRDSFRRTNERYYGAAVTELDPYTTEATRTINEWVGKKTDGLIRRAVDTVFPGVDVLFLVNAVYLKGRWAEPFDLSQTRERDFHLSDGSTAKVMAMWRADEFDYVRGNGFQAIRVPYSGGRFGMYVFLPDSGSSLASFVHELDFLQWRVLLDSFQRRTGGLLLPKMKVGSKMLGLNPALTTLGMGEAFEYGLADFTRMTTLPRGEVWIREVIHNSVIEVDETGTVAAASTAVEMTCGLPRTTFGMVVDRPFLLAIVDSKTGAVVFLGAINDPTK
ncbi:serpin family protein [candidate division WOR-3 bacterium]|nr:serpin family protein [candidate division WOR-3 bacterium]